MAYFCQTGVATLSFCQGDNRLFMIGSYDRISFPVPNGIALVYFFRSIMNRASTYNLASSIRATSITLLFLLLAPKRFSQYSSRSLLSIDMLTKTFLANRRLRGYLFWTKLFLNVGKGALQYLRINTSGITAAKRSFYSKPVSLIKAVTAPYGVSFNLPRNGRFTPIQVPGYLCTTKTFFQKTKNLISALSS